MAFLSNIIQRVDSFKHSFLEVERGRRYCRYRLSPLDIAHAVMKDNISQEVTGQNSGQGGRKIFSDRSEMLEKFKEKNYDENWKTNFEGALLRRVPGQGQQGLGGSVPLVSQVADHMRRKQKLNKASAPCSYSFL